MNYVLWNPPLVYQHQREGHPVTYGAGRTSENSRHVQAVVPVQRLVEQLRRTCSSDAAIAAKKIT
jgi:hypothetical protein